MSSNKLECLSVSKLYEKNGNKIWALKNLNLEVKEGEFLAIVGPSGCGKSTLLKLMASLERPTEGKILLDGKELRDPGPERAMVFQYFSLFPWCTVLENVEFGLKMLNVEEDERRERALHYIKLVGLEGFEDYYPRQLSGGMKQRVALARALAVDPEVLLMDEPFGSLDAQTRNFLQAELLKIWEEEKKTIVFVTHSIIEAVYLGDRVVLMTSRPGRVKEVFEIDIERPRDKGSSEFSRVRSEILSSLKKEVLKTISSEYSLDLKEIAEMIR